MASTNPFDDHTAPPAELPPRTESLAHQEQPAPAPAHEEAHEPVNPAVAQLKSMFPDFDDIVLQSVLDSVNGDQDAAVDLLLGMSDPSYVPTHQTPEVHPSQASANPSLDLDEQLARQLAMEDERSQREGQHRARGENWQRRSGEHQAAPPPSSPPASGPDFQEIKETLNQFAESGKRTFSSIVSRVRAKINEYEQTRTTSQPPQHPPPSWGVPSQSSGGQGSNPSTFPSYYHEPQQPIDRHAASQSFAPYYGASGEDQEGWQSVGSRGRQDRVVQQPQPQEIRGYDIDGQEITTTQYSTPFPAPAHVSEPHPTTPPAAASAEAAAKSNSPTPGSPEARAASPSADVLRPPQTLSGSPLDATKFGLLPKRPVSLLTPQATSSKPSEDDDDDELDYVENPFDDKRKPS